MELVSVKDDLPKEGQAAFGYDVAGFVTSQAIYIGNNEWGLKGTNNSLFLTHWKPLPEPPK